MSADTCTPTVMKAMRGLDPVRVENPCGPGTPDINYLHGWVEVKWLRHWPRGADTPVRVEKYTEVQRNWHRRRIRAGGVVWVILKVGRDWLLFKGDLAADHLGKLNRAQTLALAHAVWTKGLNSKELRTCLTS
jgi:hypothetical protein